MTALPEVTLLYNKIALRIITEQENLVGTLAWQEAGRVQGLEILDTSKSKISITNDPKNVIDSLVAKYEGLFGKMASDVCRASVSDLLPELSFDEIPDSLK